MHLSSIEANTCAAEIYLYMTHPNISELLWLQGDYQELLQVSTRALGHLLSCKALQGAEPSHPKVPSGSH